MSESWCSSLIDAALVREDFILKTDIIDDAFSALWNFEKDYLLAKGNETQTIGSLLIQHKLLTSDHIENLLASGNNNQISSWAKKLGDAPPSELTQLIERDQLSTAVVCQLLNENENLLASETFLKALGKVVTPGASNGITWGIDKVEYERWKGIVLNWEAREEFLKMPDYENPLLAVIGAREHLSSKKTQIEQVIPPDDVRSPREQMEDVWNHYAKKSSMFGQISQETSISDAERKDNIANVNNYQCNSFAKGNKDLFADFDQRFIDIYARYNKGEMDPFMLAIITRTVGWYLDQGHSRLFTQARLVSDRIVRTKGGLDKIPFVSQFMFPKIKVLDLYGSAFERSVFGANRLFLTHSDARQSSDIGSVPIIGLATWKNGYKFNPRDRYTLLRADFDKKDPHRSANILRQICAPQDRAASIAGVIDQTLLALRNVEKQQISYANEAGFSNKAELSNVKSQNPNPQVASTLRRNRFSNLNTTP